MQADSCAPFLFGLMNGPSKCKPKILAPLAPPLVFWIRGITSRYTFCADVTIVGQNDVTPCAKMPLATFLTPSSTLTMLFEKSMPNPPVDVTLSTCYWNANQKKKAPKIKPEWRTIYLYVNEPWSYYCTITIDLFMWFDFLIEKHRFRIYYFTISNPKIINNQLMISYQSAIFELNDFKFGTIIDWVHCHSDAWTQMNARFFSLLLYKTRVFCNSMRLVHHNWCRLLFKCDILSAMIIIIITNESDACFSCFHSQFYNLFIMSFITH